MQSDTIVGIVGSLILVGVMAGVFVYEYNNPADTADTSSFAADYPNLAPQDDLDGDGTPNAEDEDLDGDGTINAEDTHIVVKTEMGGMLGPQAQPAVVNSVSLGFVVGSGNVMVDGFVNYTALLPSPAPLTPAYVVELLDESGEVVASAGQASVTGMAASYHITVVEALAPGDYSIRVTQEQGSGGNFRVTSLVHYEAA